MRMISSGSVEIAFEQVHRLDGYDGSCPVVDVPPFALRAVIRCEASAIGGDQQRCGRLRVLARNAGGRPPNRTWLSVAAAKIVRA